MSVGDQRLLLALSGDVHLKSSRTRRRFHRILRENLEDALAPVADRIRLEQGPQGRWSIVPRAHDVDLEAVARIAARVFGVIRVELVREVPAEPVDDLVQAAAALTRDRVRGRTFAVRARRRGSCTVGSMDVERRLGAELLDASGGVDLDRPEHTVRVQVWPHAAYVEEDRFAGADGLPLRTQPRVLGLLSGGFDSAVAAWLLMRRGAPVDFVHFVMDCAQSEHAMAVAFDLWRRWGAGTEPIVWLVDFQDVKEHLFERVDGSHRQVALKRLMLEAAERVAVANHREVLVTGDSVGQVSTQTITNLAQIEADRTLPVLRPLAGFTKDEIVDRARHIGTHDLSSRAREVCDLSTGRVETAARRGRLLRSMRELPDDVVDLALSTTQQVHLPTWSPGETGGTGAPRPAAHDLGASDSSSRLYSSR